MSKVLHIIVHDSHFEIPVSTTVGGPHFDHAKPLKVDTTGSKEKSLRVAKIAMCAVELGCPSV